MSTSKFRDPTEEWGYVLNIVVILVQKPLPPNRPNRRHRTKEALLHKYMRFKTKCLVKGCLSPHSIFKQTPNKCIRIYTIIPASSRKKTNKNKKEAVIVILQLNGVQWRRQPFNINIWPTVLMVTEKCPISRPFRSLRLGKWEPGGRLSKVLQNWEVKRWKSTAENALSAIYFLFI